MRVFCIWMVTEAIGMDGEWSLNDTLSKKRGCLGYLNISRVDREKKVYQKIKKRSHQRGKNKAN